MPNALNQKLRPSPELAKILSRSEPLTRAEAVKKLWEYVKQHSLQNPENKREILADEALKPIFGKDKITMFEVGKVINSHLRSGEAESSKKQVA